MPPDPRHLRARWTLAVIGWLLWAMLMPLPRMIWSFNRLWQIYPDALRAIMRLDRIPKSPGEAIGVAALTGFVLSSGIFFFSPLLVACNHSYAARIRRWRWMGMGLLGIIELSVLLMTRSGGPSSWIAHLLVLSYLLVCIAIIPWPRERTIIQSGFEVLIPAQQPRPAAPTAEEK